MPVYEFVCAGCGRFDATFSLADVPDSTACACGERARRAVSSPHFGRTGSAMRLLDATKSTADRPAVVERVPPGSGAATPRTANPLHAKLPRP